MKKINLTPDGIEEVELSAEELAQRETDIENASKEKTNEATEKENLDNLKASAKAKLIAGEKLTEEEANILVGV